MQCLKNLSARQGSQITGKEISDRKMPVGEASRAVKRSAPDYALPPRQGLSEPTSRGREFVLAGFIGGIPPQDAAHLIEQLLAGVRQAPANQGVPFPSALRYLALRAGPPDVIGVLLDD
jgi:hypothetical protein